MREQKPVINEIGRLQGAKRIKIKRFTVSLFFILLVFSTQYLMAASSSSTVKSLTRTDIRGLNVGSKKPLSPVNSQPAIDGGAEYILVAFSETIDGWRLAINYDAGETDQGHQQGYGMIYPSFPDVLAPSHTNRVYSIYCSLASDAPSPTTPMIFGYEELGGSNTGLDKIQGSVFTAPASGTATSITVGVRSSYGSSLGLTVAIYKHGDNSLVAVTEEISVPAQYKGWVTLGFAKEGEKSQKKNTSPPTRAKRNPSKELSDSSSGAIAYPSNDPIIYTSNNTVTPLHVDGRYLKDANDEIVLLKGAAFGDLAWRYQDEETFQGGVQGRFQDYLNHFGDYATVVRLPIGGGSLDYDLSAHMTLQNSVRELVELCIANDKYVILDFHGGIGQARAAELGLNPEPLYKWWDFWLSQKTSSGVPYALVPNVLVEFYNEPYGKNFGGTDVWRSIVETGVQRIQVHNPSIVIIVSSYNFNLIDSIYLTNPLPGNVVYSWDYYYKDYGSAVQAAYESGDYVTGRSLMEAKMYQNRLDYAVNYDLPIVCSEFGFHIDHFTGAMVEQAVWDYIDIMNDAETGWLNWMWWTSGNYGLCDNTYSTLRFPTGTVMQELII